MDRRPRPRSRSFPVLKFSVLGGLGPVFFRSFSGLETGLTNTTVKPLDRAIRYRTAFIVEARIFNLTGGWCYDFSTNMRAPYVRPCCFRSSHLIAPIRHASLFPHADTCLFLHIYKLSPDRCHTLTTCVPYIYHESFTYINRSRIPLYLSLLFIRYSV